jgi:hypothetical protein
MTRRLGTGLVVVAFVAAALSGCGSDDESSSSASDKSPLQGWAQGLCTSVAEWQASIKSTSAKAASSVDDFAESEAAVISADNAFVASLEGLGTPPDPASTVAKDAIDELSTTLGDDAGGIMSAVSQVSTTAEIKTATAQVKALLSDMNSDISKTVTELKALPDTEGWKAAFEQVPACHGLGTG